MKPLIALIVLFTAFAQVSTGSGCDPMPFEYSADFKFIVPKRLEAPKSQTPAWSWGSTLTPMTITN